MGTAAVLFPPIDWRELILVCFLQCKTTAAQPLVDYFEIRFSQVE